VPEIFNTLALREPRLPANNLPGPRRKPCCERDHGHADPARVFEQTPAPRTARKMCAFCIIAGSGMIAPDIMSRTNRQFFRNNRMPERLAGPAIPHGSVDRASFARASGILRQNTW